MIDNRPRYNISKINGYFQGKSATLVPSEVPNAKKSRFLTPFRAASPAQIPGIPLDHMQNIRPRPMYLHLKFEPDRSKARAVTIF